MKRIATLIITFIVGFLSMCNITAQTKTSWIVEQTFEVPFNAETDTVTSEDGTVKHYIVLENGQKIFVHKSSFEKFKNRERGLLLVEWVNVNTGKYKYTTRLAEQNNSQTKATITWKSSKDQ